LPEKGGEGTLSTLEGKGAYGERGNNTGRLLLFFSERPFGEREINPLRRGEPPVELKVIL